MNDHYTETRIVARLAGELEAAQRHGNLEEAAELGDQLAVVREKLIARGIPQRSIQRALDYPIFCA